MPNLQQVIDDPRLLQASADDMMSGKYERREVVLNDGFRTAADVDAHVAKAPPLRENIEAYRQILDADHERKQSG